MAAQLLYYRGIVPIAPVPALVTALINRAVAVNAAGAPVGPLPALLPGAPAMIHRQTRIQRAQGAVTMWNGSAVTNGLITATDRIAAAQYQGILLDINGLGYKIKVFDITGAPYIGGAAPAPPQNYIVVVSEIGAACSCPDCQIYGNACKHIFFVLHNQFGIPAAALINNVAIRAALSIAFAAMG